MYCLLSGCVACVAQVVPTLLTLQGISVPATMQGSTLPHLIADAPPKDEAFAEYGAGGPPFLLSDLQRLPQPWGRKTLIATLQWREAEGRRKMCRTREWKYVHDAMVRDLDELCVLLLRLGDRSSVPACCTLVGFGGCLFTSRPWCPCVCDVCMYVQVRPVRRPMGAAQRCVRCGAALPGSPAGDDSAAG
jgi:hypothetical protein